MKKMQSIAAKLLAIAVSWHALDAAAEHKDAAPIPQEVINKLVSRARFAAPPRSMLELEQHLKQSQQLVHSALQTEEGKDESYRMTLAGKRAELAALKTRLLDELEAQAQKSGTSTTATNAISLDALVNKGHASLNAKAQSTEPGKRNFPMSEAISQRFETLDKALAAVEKADKHKRRAAFDNLQKVLASLKAPETGLTAPIPTWQHPAAPRPWSLPKSEKYPQYAQNEIESRLTQYAYTGGDSLLAAAPATPTEAQKCGYTTQDLDLNATDAQVTDDIKALAQQLNYSPGKIFQYVYNNIKFEPYYGSMKGAQATLLSKAGGPTDQASLLVALLRASNVPARYVSGQISITDNDTSDGGRVARWVGAKTQFAAKTILNQGYFAPSYSAALKTVGLNHVWVEACVPYGRYRGSWQDNSGERWIPLDPSFKDVQYSGGFTSFTPVVTKDFLNTLLAKRGNGADSLVQEAYLQAVDQQVRASDFTMTAQDVPYVGTIKPIDTEVLPAALPYSVSSFTNWPGTSSPEIASLPSQHRYKLYLNGLNLTQPYTAYMADIALKRLSLEFYEATGPIPVNVVNGPIQSATFSPNPVFGPWQTSNTKSTLSCLTGGIDVLMMPRLLADGVVQKIYSSTPLFTFTQIRDQDGFLIGSNTSYVGALALCSQNTLQIEVALEQTQVGAAPPYDQKNCMGSGMAPGAVNCVLYNNISPVNIYSIQAYAYQNSDAVLASKVSSLNATVTNAYNAKTVLDNASNSMETLEGAFYDLVGRKYMRYLSESHKTISALKGSSGMSGPHIGLVSGQAKMSYVFDLPYAISAGGFLVDVRGGQSWSTKLDVTQDQIGHEIDFDDFLLSTYAGSLYESYLWQENASLDAVSTVRGLQFAQEANSAGNGHPIGLVTIPGGTSAADFTSTQLTTGGTVDQNSYQASDLSTIQDLVTNKKFTVTLPKSLIPYYAGQWVGIVYEAECNNCDGSGNVYTQFAINNEKVSAGGGYAVGDPLSGNSFSSALQNDYLSSSFAPSYISNTSLMSGGSYSMFADTAPVGLLTSSNGYTSNMTLSGDPVNMVTGNLYHNETDFRMSGKGGLPIVLTRSYNSRNPELGSFGYGWTSNFNARLKFYGTETVKGTVYAKLSWIDGTGSEKFFQTSKQSNGSITWGATIDNPPGVFVKFRRSDLDGSYTIQEKNGLTYLFTVADGPSGTAGTGTTPTFAYLKAITDRNGNSINVNYYFDTVVGAGGGTYQVNRGFVSTVTDSGGILLQFKYSNQQDGGTTVSGTITKITELRTNRVYTYKYEDGNNNLTSYLNPLAGAGKQPGVKYSYYSATDGPSLAHAMKQYTLPRGNGMKFEYYANGRVFRHSVVKLDGSVAPDQVNTFTYNDFRRETVQTNERSGQKHFFFDPFGNPVKVVEENGAQHSYQYDCAYPTVTPPDPAATAGTGCRYPYNRISETDAMGLTTNYSYDSNGNVWQVQPPSGNTGAVQYYDFNSFAQPRRILNANGNWTVQIYDSNGNLTNSIQTNSNYTPPATGCGTGECPVPALNQIASWTVNGYDAFGDLTSTKRVRDFAAEIASPGALQNTGPILTYTYPSGGWPATATSRVGRQNADTTATTVNTASLSYDAAHRLKDGVDADWYPIHADYDDLDRAYNATDKLGKSRNYTFDANGNPNGQSLTVSLQGNPTVVDSSSTLYDDSDRAVQKLDAAGNVTAYAYDGAGNVVTISNPDNYSISYDYDAANRPVHAYDQQGHSVTTERDVSGRTRSVTDANGNKTTYTYWDASRNGRLKSVTYPTIKNNGSGTAFTSGRSLQYDYDGAGNVTSVTEALANGCGGASNCPRVTSTSYDALNRPVRIVGPVYNDTSLGGLICPVTVNTYDNLGNLHQVSTGYTPSPCATVASDVTKTRLTQDFDDFGRMIKRTDALGRYWQYVYDSHNNVQTVTDAKNQVTSYTWGTGHQLLTRKDQEGRTASYTRNALGQVQTVSYPEVNYTYGYDTAHRLTAVTDSRGNKTLTYNLSPGGLLNSMTDSEGRTTSYLYDPVGRLTDITAPNGDTVAYQFDAGGRLIQRTMPNGVSSHYVYNEDNSLHQVVNNDKSGHVFTQHDYAYDGFGNRAKLSENVNGTTLGYAYSYDELKRLTQVTNGTDAQQESYTYDPRDNRLSRSIGVSGPTVTAYVYNDDNQLTEIRSGSATGALQTTLSYDNNGNILTDDVRAYSWDSRDQLKQVSGAGTTVIYGYDDSGRRIRKTVGGAVTQWLYDGQDIYAAYGKTWTNAGMLFTSGGGTDDPVIGTSVTGPSTYGQANYYHADGLGSVVGVSNSAGTTPQSQRFDAWGNPISGGTVAQSAQYGYTGREPDETGLVYMRARYYNPALARFVSKDPAGLQGGPNAYAYCGNDPVNCTDPSGMLPSFNNTIAQNQFSSYYTSPSMSDGGLSSGFQSLANTASSALSNLGQSLANTVSYGMFKTDAQLNAWGAGLQAAQQQGPSGTADFLRSPGNLPGGWMKDAAAAAVSLGIVPPATASFSDLSVATPYGLANQSTTAAALGARADVQGGATLYRIGTTGRSQAAEAQFWSLEHPLSPGYANRYGLPAENMANANFIEAAGLRPGTPFITRPAPGIGQNVGGGIEVVVPSGGVQMKWFTGTP